MCQKGERKEGTERKRNRGQDSKTGKGSLERGWTSLKGDKMSQTIDLSSSSSVAGCLSSQLHWPDFRGGTLGN